MGRRYLTWDETRSAVTSGRPVGQFLGFERGTTESTFRYVEISRTHWRDTVNYVVWLSRKVDDGDGLFVDLGEFPDAENVQPDFSPDSPTPPDDLNRHEFTDADSAFEWCASALATNRDRWVNASMLGDEYLQRRPG